MTRKEVIRRLEQMEREIGDLKTALMEEWVEDTHPVSTETFLAKCSGWEDTRTPEEIIAEIYTSRTHSQRGAALFEESQCPVS